MNHESIRFIALDMDGTILDRNYNLSQAVSDTLQVCRAAGKKVLVSTGRVYASVMRHTQRLGKVDGYVCSNGADVYDHDGAVISQLHIDENVSRRLIEISREHDSHFHVFKGDSWFYEREKSYTDFYIKRSGLAGTRADFDTMGTLSLTKCMFLDDHERLEAIAASLLAELKTSVQVMYSAPFMLEVVANGVNKAAGLAACLGHLHGSFEETIAFGDADNDLDMLLAAGIGVAMGNAAPEVKAKANMIAPSVDEDGVAVFLREFFRL